jgi:flagellar biosynthesis protein FlhA
VRDNIQLDAEAYRILVGGREVARGSIRPNLWLAIDPGGARLALTGEDAKEPAFGLPAKWISETERQRAEMAGYTVVDAPSVLITHLGEVVRRHANELLSREDLKSLVDKVRETSPAVVDELIPNMLTMGSLHRILTLLLEERVPITNLARILEALANFAQTIKDPTELSERVRLELGRTICDRFRDEQGRIRAIVFDPRVEIELRRSVQDKQIVFDPSRLEQMIVRISGEMRKANARGIDVALLCDSSLRRPLRHTMARAIADLSVIAYQEIPIDMLMEPVALIRPEDLTGGSSPVAATLGMSAAGS